MKNILLFTLTFNFFIIGNCFSQKKTTKDKEQVEHLIVKSFDEIFSNRNKNKIDTFFTEDFLLLENGIIWNRDSLSINLDRMNAQIAERKITVNRVNKIEFINVKIDKDIAWLAYYNTAIYNDGNGKIYGEDTWLESVFAIRTKDGWKIQMLHSTSKK